MPKFSPMIHGKRKGYSFQCPGCGCCHMILTDGGTPHWTFNGNVDKPLVRPSIKVRYYSNELKKKMVCHSFIRDGEIQFLNDSTHDLKGQTVEIPEW